MDRTWISFSWDVPADGFQWLPGRSTDERRRSKPTLYLSRVRRDIGEGAEQRSRHLPGIVAAIQKAVGVGGTQDGILAFANKYGSLGAGEPFQLKASGAVVAGQPLIGESIDLWQEQIATMSRLTALWDLCRQQDLAALARHIRWQADKEGHPAVHYDSHPGKSSGEKGQPNPQGIGTGASYGKQENRSRCAGLAQWIRKESPCGMEWSAESGC